MFIWFHPEHKETNLFLQNVSCQLQWDLECYLICIHMLNMWIYCEPPLYPCRKPWISWAALNTLTACFWYTMHPPWKNQHWNHTVVGAYMHKVKPNIFLFFFFAFIAFIFVFLSFHCLSFLIFLNFSEFLLSLSSPQKPCQLDMVLLICFHLGAGFPAHHVESNICIICLLPFKCCISHGSCGIKQGATYEIIGQNWVYVGSDMYLHYSPWWIDHPWGV